MQTILIFSLLLVSLVNGKDFDWKQRFGRGDGGARDLDINTQGNKGVTMRFRARDSSAALQRADFQFTTAGFPRFRLSLQEKSGGNTTSSTWRVGLLKVVEFNGTSFNPATDRVLSSISLLGHQSGGSFSSIARSTEKWQNGTVDVYVFTTTLTTSRATITLKVRVADVVAEGNGTVLGPNALKFDIIITNYQFVSNTSSLAVIAMTQTRSKVRVDSYDNAGEVVVESSRTGHFAWDKNVQKRNGNSTKDVSVTTSIISLDSTEYNDGDDDDRNSNEATTVLAFSFNAAGNPNELVWDPELGVDASNNNNSNGVSAFSPGFLSVLFLLAPLFRLF